MKSKIWFLLVCFIACLMVYKYTRPDCEDGRTGLILSDVNVRGAMDNARKVIECRRLMADDRMKENDRVIENVGFKNLSNMKLPRRYHKPLLHLAPPDQYGRSRDDGAWIRFPAANDTDLLAFSAFYDNRLSLASFPVVRVISVIGGDQDNMAVFCKLYFPGSNDPMFVEGSLGKIGFGVPVDQPQNQPNTTQVTYREYIVTCPLGSERVPDAVALTDRRDSSHHVNVTHGVVGTADVLAIPVEIPATLHPSHEKPQFGVCVSIAFGDFNPVRLVEWLELQRLLGVSLVTIYNNTLSEHVARVFQYYNDQGFVDFRQSHHFLPATSSRIVDLHSTPAINDCLYRNMHRFQKLVVVDLDELIIPQNAFSLSEMLQQVEQQQGVEKPHPARSYTFRNHYMFLDLPANETETLTMLKYRFEVEISPEGYSSKSIIDPQACTHVHNHYCWEYTKLYSTPGHHLEVHPDFARNRHYKKCHFDEKECAKLFPTAQKTDFALKYKPALEHNTRPVFEALGLS